MLENTHNHMIMIFVKHIFAPDICLRLRSLLRFFVKRGPGRLAAVIINHPTQVLPLPDFIADSSPIPRSIGQWAAGFIV